MTAKNAVNALYRILAGWLAPEIRVNCVVPGFVKTDMFRHHSPDMWKLLVSTVPMDRMATPMDVAQAALYLVTSASLRRSENPGRGCGFRAHSGELSAES